MTLVEQALKESPRHMTVSEIAAATTLNVDYVRHTLHDMAAADRIDHIPARGITPGRYALKSTPAGASPDAQLQVAQNSSCNGSDFHPFAEAVAVAIENPEPDAALPPATAEGSGGDVSDQEFIALDLMAQSGYIVLAAKRKPARFTKLDNAREAAKSAIRAGAQRAEVFALVRVGVARKGAEWIES